MNIPKTCKNYIFETDTNVFSWLDTDNKSNYIDNCKNFPNEMENWKNKSLTYKLNRFGFRNQQSFDNIKSSKKTRALALGCSHTFGLGMPNEDIWPTIVSEKLQWEIINLGMPGGSLDSVFRILYTWFSRFQPDYILIQEPTKERREFFLDNNEIITAGAWRETFLKFSYLNWGDSFNELYSLKNKMAIQSIVGNTPTFYFNIEDFRKDDLARDMIHFGKSTHECFSNHIYSFFK
jgi:hypothetical protein